MRLAPRLSILRSSRGVWGGDGRGQLVNAELITDCCSQKCRHGWPPSGDSGSCSCPLRFPVTGQTFDSFLWEHMLQALNTGVWHRCYVRNLHACFCLRDPSQELLIHQLELFGKEVCFKKKPAYVLCDLKQEASREDVMGLSVNIGSEMEGKQYSNATRELLCSGQQFCGDSAPRADSLMI